jgi:hypothetical protein
MNKPHYKRLVLVFLIASLPARARQPSSSANISPFKFVQKTCNRLGQPEISNETSTKQLSQDIKHQLHSPNLQSASFYFCLAERMKRVGDYRAKEYYEKAIQVDETEPNYELFYADYLRIFRGAQTPLFPQSEEHYLAAWKKARARNNGPLQDMERFVLRGLSALYQMDGVALLPRELGSFSEAKTLAKPSIFFASIFRASQSDADLDREADIRDYTSEALFAESQARLGRPLTEGELRTLIRLKKAFETLDRIRIRYRAWPVFDVFYTHRQTNRDQVTNFFCITPTSSVGCNAAGLHPFNTLRFNDFGVTAQKPFTALRVFDFSLTGTFEKTERWGLIEFFPGNEESILEYGTRLVGSHFVGPDKINFEVGYTYQHIHPIISPAQSDRDRHFLDARLTYQIFRPLPLPSHPSAYQHRFETRGWDFFAGTLQDVEQFGTGNTKRQDYYVGSSLRGIGRFDFTVQPTWFTSRVVGDLSQRNTQYRTNASILFRIVDEEKNAGIKEKTQGLHLAFLHAVVPYRYDVTRVGPSDFENRKIGIGLDSKFFAYSRWTTLLFSVRYDRQRFFNLNRNMDAVSGSLSLGF